MSTRADESPLLHAAQWGDADAVRALLARPGVLPDHATEALFAACCAPLCADRDVALGTVEEIAPLLLAHGADPGDDRVRGLMRGLTPLHFAARAQSPSLVRLLLEHGARPDARNEFGETPLLLACAQDTEPPTAVLEQLVGSSLVDVGMHPRCGSMTPLFLAVSRGHCAAAEFLLRQGADPLRALSGCESPLEHAIRHGASALVARILAGLPPEPAWNGTREARAAPTAALLRSLLAAGAPADGHDSPSVLIHAVQSTRDGALDIAAAALAAGARVAATYAGRQALHWAALKRSMRKVALLLDHGAPVDARTDDGQTAIMLTLAEPLGQSPFAEPWDDALVRLLVARGVPLDARDDQGESAFDKAQRLDDGGRVAELFLQLGAHPSPLVR